MNIAAVVSMKGGVGKTSITANLAAAMSLQFGKRQIAVVDLDPQNSLHLHFGLGSSQLRGVCEMSVKGLCWDRVSAQSNFGVVCLPYGNVNEVDRAEFELILERNPNFLGEQLQLAGFGNDTVIIDTPPGPSVYLKQVFACADIVVMVLLADAGSYATVPAMESWVNEMQAIRPQLRSVYVLNQMDSTAPLNRDVAEVLRQHLGARLVRIGIHRDEAVGEALAFQQPVVSYDPHSQATRDLRQLAVWLNSTLGS